MSATGFTKKRIDVTISLATGAGSFDGTGNNTVKLSGLRMMADMINAGGESMGALQLRVFGLPQSMMNQLTNIGGVSRVDPLNKVLLEAGDDAGGMQMVFMGTIYNAWGDYSSQPDAALNILANAGMDAFIKPVGPSSYGNPSTDVATIMADLAKTMGLGFENNGVQVKLSYPYFPGTALAQVRACARAARINYSVDRGTLAIWEQGTGRDGEIPVISPSSGMVGYPHAVGSKVISLKTLFNSSIRPGSHVMVDSSLPMANGKFRVGPVSHSLSSELPGGPWFTTLEECYFVSK
jgi:hypothetical protein